MADELVIVINPGSTSTKLAAFNRDGNVLDRTIVHDEKELAKFELVTEQFQTRFAQVNEFLNQVDALKSKVVAVVGRGGPVKPIEGGVYAIGSKLLEDLRSCRYSNHASNLGAMIAKAVGDHYMVPSYVVDPITIDEFIPEARISGHPEIERKSRSHILNIRAVSRKTAAKLGKTIEDCNFIVAHMGGGISIAPLRKGRQIDVNNALLGEGPFSPERAGTLPIEGLIDYFVDKLNCDRAKLYKILSKESGLKGYLGTAKVEEVEQRIASGDDKARLILDAMIYRIAKDIGALAAVLRGEVDRIILTGGIAYSEYVVNGVKGYVSFIAPIEVVPGEGELEAMAQGGFLAIDRKVEIKEYK